LIPHLGGTDRHWKSGRSAHALATVWFQANEIPESIRKVLAAHPAYAELKLVDGFFERRVDLGDGKRPSQTDLMAICADRAGLFLLGVEGKVDKTFGPVVGEWLESSSTKKARLEKLCAI